MCVCGGGGNSGGGGGGVVERLLMGVGGVVTGWEELTEAVGPA